MGQKPSFKETIFSFGNRPIVNVDQKKTDISQTDPVNLPETQDLKEEIYGAADNVRGTLGNKQEAEKYLMRLMNVFFERFPEKKSGEAASLQKFGGLSELMLKEHNVGASPELAQLEKSMDRYRLKKKAASA